MAFADSKINVQIVKKSLILLERVKNIERKEVNAGYQHFLLFPECFQKLSYPGSLKVRIGKGLRKVGIGAQAVTMELK